MPCSILGRVSKAHKVPTVFPLALFSRSALQYPLLERAVVVKALGCVNTEYCGCVELSSLTVWPAFSCAGPTVKPVITKVEAKSSTSIQVTWQVSTLCMRRQLFSVQYLCTAAGCAAWCTVPTTQREVWEKSLGWRTSWRVRVTRGVRTVTWSGKEHRLTRSTPRWVDLIGRVCGNGANHLLSAKELPTSIAAITVDNTLVRGQFLVKRSKAGTFIGMRRWTFTFVTFRIVQDPLDLSYPELRPVGVWPMCATDIVSWRSTNPLAWLFFFSSSDQPVGSMDRSLRTEFCMNLTGNRSKRRTWERFQTRQLQSAHWRKGRSTR